jgi:type I restriction enzyme S subunit
MGTIKIKEITSNFSKNSIVPTDWKIKRLGEICSTFKSGYGITSEDISINGKYAVYGGNGLRGYCDRYTHEGNYFLIGRQGALCGNIVRVFGKNYISEHAIAVKTDDYNDNLFLAYKLEFQNLNRLSESSAQPGLSVEKLIKLKITLPPHEEQCVIAHLLMKWDEAITKTQSLIAQKELRKKWLMQNLLTGKKRLKGFEGEKWKKVGAGELFASFTKKGFENEELLSATQDRGIIPRSQLDGRVTMPDGTTAGYKLVVPGDFIISLRSFQGGLEYSYYRGIVSPAYIVLKPKNKINDEFYKQYYKSSEFIGRLSIAVIGIRDGKQISYDDFCTIKIPYPSHEEQTVIAEVLQIADREIRLLKAKLDKFKEQKKGLMQVLLTGKKRLKIDN